MIKTKKMKTAKEFIIYMLALLLGLAIAFGVVGPLVTKAHAKPLEMPYSNNITAEDGLTLAITGPLYVMFHGQINFHPTSMVRQNCTNNYVPMPIVSYGLMVRSQLDVVNAENGEAYRTHGSFKDSKAKAALTGSAFCGDVMAWSWTDNIDIITPEGVRTFTLKFYTEVDMLTESLLHIEVESAQLN